MWADGGFESVWQTLFGAITADDVSAYLAGTGWVRDPDTDAWVSRSGKQVSLPPADDPGFVEALVESVARVLDRPVALVASRVLATVTYPRLGKPLAEEVFATVASPYHEKTALLRGDVVRYRLELVPDVMESTGEDLLQMVRDLCPKGGRRCKCLKAPPNPIAERRYYYPGHLVLVSSPRPGHGPDSRQFQVGLFTPEAADEAAETSRPAENPPLILLPGSRGMEATPLVDARGEAIDPTTAATEALEALAAQDLPEV